LNKGFIERENRAFVKLGLCHRITQHTQYRVKVYTQASKRTLSFVGESREDLEKYKDFLFSSKNTDKRTRIYAAKVVKPGNWNIEWLVRKG